MPLSRFLPLLLLLLLLAAAPAHAQSVTFAWDAPVPQAGELLPDGYVLTRNGADVQRTTSTQVADPLPGPGTYTYTVQAVAGVQRSGSSAPLTLTAAALACTLVQTPEQLSLTCPLGPASGAPLGPYPLRPVGSLTATADSQETVARTNPASNAVDGLLPTLWHTQYSGAAPPLPHTLTLDLGAVLWVDGLLYTPRTDSSRNGTLTTVRVETTLDGTTWTVAAAATWAADATAKAVRFPAVQARSVRLVGLVSNGTPYASAAEVGVYASDGGTP